MKKMPACILVLLSVCIIHGSCSNPSGGSVITAPVIPLDSALYVVPVSVGKGDGSSWDNATNDLQAAIEAAALRGSRKTHVLIKAGTYSPKGYPNLDGVQTDVRLKHFSLRNGITVIGGFLGNEEDSNPLGGTTFLSGGPVTGGVPGADNVYHVFYHPEGTGLDNTAVLENVTVIGGSSNGGANHECGGGMYNTNSSPILDNCTLSWNNSTGNGGGMYNANSSPILDSCTLSWNNSTDNGGGMCNANSNPVLDNCTVLENNATWFGGGMANSSSSPVLNSCTFSGNSATYDLGGGMYNTDSSPVFTNCTFSGNNASTGGGMANQSSSSPVFTNCTFSGNSSTGIGGGMYNQSSSSPVFTNCTFSGNNASGGGGLSNDSSSPVFTNCTFSGNSSTGIGGGMANWSSSNPVLISCTFSGNRTGNIGGGMYNQSSSIPTVFGSIFAGNYLIDGSAVSEIEGDSIDLASADNLIRGTNYGGIMNALFEETDGDGNTEHGVLGDTVGSTGTKTIMVKEITAVQFNIPSGGKWIPDNAEVPEKDQRGYTRSKAGGIAYKGSVDPRVQ